MPLFLRRPVATRPCRVLALSLGWLALPGCFTTSESDPPRATVTASTTPTEPSTTPTQNVMPACSADQECATPTAQCIAGACVDQDCESLADCPEPTVCDPTINRCVECVSNLECTAADRICVATRCVEPCAGDEACLPLVCSESAGECVACDVANTCPAGFVCSDLGCIADLDAGMNVFDAAMNAGDSGG